jgi:hypothetical protein
MSSPDYMKYWRVIRYWVKAMYDLTETELDVLFFLKTEPYFNKDKFKEFDKVLSWDKNRFSKLLRDGWIVVWRKREANKKKALYKLSHKGVHLVNTIYKKLEGQEIAVNNNRIFNANTKYTDTMYRQAIVKMNEELRAKRQQQRPSQE